MATEQIEIKVNIGGVVDAAIESLGLDNGEPREIYFLEDLTPGLASSHPLLDAGLALRLRRESDGAGDSTVKLRPCRRSQLTSDWSEPAGEDGQWEYRIEGDWAGERRKLAASLVRELTADELTDGLAHPARAFGSRQRDFLQDCGSMRVNLSALSVLGPISATRWSKIKVDSVSKVNAERWRVGSLDFLELSRRVDDDKAAVALAELTAAAQRVGLTLDASSLSKTEQVLDVLAAQV